MGGGQALKGGQRIGDDEDGHVRRGLVRRAAHDDAAGASLQSVADEGVTVLVLALQGNEKVAGLDHARVGRHPPKLGGRSPAP